MTRVGVHKLVPRIRRPKGDVGGEDENERPISHARISPELNSHARVIRSIYGRPGIAEGVRPPFPERMLEESRSLRTSTFSQSEPTWTTCPLSAS